MGPRNFGIHLKDHDNEKESTWSSARACWTCRRVLKALREVKFQGMISIEYEASADEPTEDVRACIQVFKDSVKKLS